MERLTDAQLAALTCKSSRDPAAVQLYRDHDYLTAYGLHTDQRVAADPHAAIGGDWEEYGQLQFACLLAQGLRRHHHLLDVGCGTGRLARKVVPYLDFGCYVGVDLSAAAIEHAEQLADSEGWRAQCPLFFQSQTLEVPNMFEFAWAHSVLIHLPAEEVEMLIWRVARKLLPGGVFLASHVPASGHVRTGLKQFKHPQRFIERVANTYGLRCKPVSWAGRQQILRMERPR